jgi:O-antigen/teichoic acid export membrane protein
MVRKNIILKNVSLGVVYKIINMGIVFITIPLLLNYLDKEIYGVWITIFSVLNIVFFVDIGIANGLKTKLTQAITNKDEDLAKTYISNAYFLMSSLALLFLAIGTFSIYFIDLKRLLNTSLNEQELKRVFFITLLMVVIGLILSLYKSLYYAIHKSYKVELSLLIYQLIVLFLVFIFSMYLPRSLFNVALIYGCSNIIISFIFTLNFFDKYSNYKPSFKLLSRKGIKNLIDLSLGFFMIQLCMIVIFSTDNILISNLLNPSEVANYDVVFKLFQAAIVFSVITQDPFWPLYTDAYEKKEFNWIKQTIIRLNKFFILFVILIAILVYISKPLISIWIPKELEISNTLVIFMGMFVILRVYGIIHMNFLNAIGKIKLQALLYMFGAIINIPLSIYFVKKLDLGTSGIILGTIVSISTLSFLLPIQVFKILKSSEINENKFD